MLIIEKGHAGIVQLQYGLKENKCTSPSSISFYRMVLLEILSLQSNFNNNVRIE